MQLAINGASTMTSDLPTDIAAAGAAGFRHLEIWAVKMDRYLQANSVSNLNELFQQHGVRPASINSIEFITFRGEEYETIRARGKELSQLAQALGCPYIVVVPSPTPSRQTTWEEIKAETVNTLRDLGTVAEAHGVSLVYRLSDLSAP